MVAYSHVILYVVIHVYLDYFRSSLKIREGWLLI